MRANFGVYRQIAYGASNGPTFRTLRPRYVAVTGNNCVTLSLNRQTDRRFGISDPKLARVAIFTSQNGKLVDFKKGKSLVNCATSRNFFSARVVDIWNELPDDVVTAPSLAVSNKN